MQAAEREQQRLQRTRADGRYSFPRWMPATAVRHSRGHLEGQLLLRQLLQDLVLRPRNHGEQRVSGEVKVSC